MTKLENLKLNKNIVLQNIAIKRDELYRLEKLVDIIEQKIQEIRWKEHNKDEEKK